MTGTVLHGVGSACVWSYKSQEKKSRSALINVNNWKLSYHQQYIISQPMGKPEKMCLPLSTCQNVPIGERGCNKESYGSPIVSSF